MNDIMIRYNDLNKVDNAGTIYNTPGNKKPHNSFLALLYIIHLSKKINQIINLPFKNIWKELQFHRILLNIMLLYHGSNVIVEKPNLSLSRKSLDFGLGFYTTVNKEQAIAFARKIAVRKGQNCRFVSIYDFNIETADPELDILRFHSPDKEWLDFVHQNRHGIYTGKIYDLIIGPVANDDVFATLIVYEQGILNVEQTIESLKIKTLYNQFVFKTEKAMSFLKYTDCFDPEVTL